MKKYLFLSLFLSFLFAQCNKDDLGDETLVEGTVMEYGTNKPLPNVPVKIRSISGEVFGSLKYQYTGDSTRTDSKGKYSIRFKHSEGTTYDAVWIEKRYTGDNGAVLDNGKRNKYDFVLNPPAWVKIKVTNINPVDSRDTIWFWGSDIPGALWTGTNVNRVYEPYPKVNGNRYNHIYTYVSKNGFATKKIDSVYCPAFDTVTYTIKY